MPPGMFEPSVRGTLGRPHARFRGGDGQESRKNLRHEHRLDVDEFLDAVMGEFAAIAALLDAAERET